MKVEVAFWEADGYPYFVDRDDAVIQAMFAVGELVSKDEPTLKEMLEGYFRMLRHKREDIEMPGYVIRKGNPEDWFLARVLDA